MVSSSSCCDEGIICSKCFIKYFDANSPDVLHPHSCCITCLKNQWALLLRHRNIILALVFSSAVLLIGCMLMIPTSVIPVTEMPSSCQDLKTNGHKLSGFYTVKGTGALRSVYCDFAKSETQAGFQTMIGAYDVKSSHVYFYVQKNTAAPDFKGKIVYEIEQLNVGNAMEMATGIFIAPKPGRYFFSLSGIGQFTSNSYTKCWVELNKNAENNNIGTAFCDGQRTWANEKHCTYTLQATISLQAGDKIFATSWGKGCRMGSYTHFNGMLVEEDIFFAA